MTTREEKQLFDSFQDKEYRDIFVEEHLNGGLAYQIRALREKQEWTQEELAARAGKKQETISQLENPDYGRCTLKTLKTLASAFDVALQVNFVSFKELIRRAVNLTPEIIAPPNYEEEYRLSLASSQSYLFLAETEEAPLPSTAFFDEGETASTWDDIEENSSKEDSIRNVHKIGLMTDAAGIFQGESRYEAA